MSRLARAGYPDAPAFFAAWERGDARLGYRITSVRLDTAGYWLSLDRTGTVPYPVDVDVTGAASTATRLIFAGLAAADSQFVASTSPAVDVRIDPDGVLPMWESSSPEIARIYVRALHDAGLSEPFLALARDFLSRHSDGELHALVVSRLFELARYNAVTEMGLVPDDSLVCHSRATCGTTILVARAFMQLGNTSRAAELLERARPTVAEHASQRLWEEAAKELTIARRRLGT